MWRVFIDGGGGVRGRKGFREGSCCHMTACDSSILGNDILPFINLHPQVILGKYNNHLIV